MLYIVSFEFVCLVPWSFGNNNRFGRITVLTPIHDSALSVWVAYDSELLGHEKEQAVTRKMWLLGMILLCGAILRFYGLGAESLWADEGITVRTVSDTFAAMKQILARAIHPPLHYLILHPVAHTFGNSEFVVRIPSAIFGIVSIFMTYRIGKLLFDTRTGLFAAGLVALSFFQIRYSQEARNYALLNMLSLFSYYYFINLLHRPSRKHTSGYLISTVLLLYTHAFGIFTIFSHNLYMLIRVAVLRKDTRPSLPHWIGLQALTVLLFVPWISVLMYHVTTRQSTGSWQKTPSLHTLSATFGVYAGSLPLLILFVSIVLLAATRWLFKPDEPATEPRGIRLSFTRMEPIYIVLVWIGSQLLTPFFLSQVMTSFYHYRYTIVASIAFYLLIALGLRQLQRTRFLLPAALAGIVAFSFFSLQKYYTEPNKERWREVAAYVDENAQNRDLLLFTAGFLLETNFNYYSQRDDLEKKPFPMLAQLIKARRGEAYDYQEDLRQMVQHHERIWLVLSHAKKLQNHMIKILNETHVLKDHQKYHNIAHIRRKPYAGIQVMVFEKRVDPPPLGITTLMVQPQKTSGIPLHPPPDAPRPGSSSQTSGASYQSGPLRSHPSRTQYPTRGSSTAVDRRCACLIRWML